MLETLLDKSGTLQRMTPSIDAIGGNSPTWGTVSGMGAVACSVAPVSWIKSQDLSRRDMVVSHEIYTAIDVGAATTDRWLIEGAYYVVKAYEKFVNPIFGPPVYVTYADKRNQS